MTTMHLLSIIILFFILAFCLGYFLKSQKKQVYEPRKKGLSHSGSRLKDKYLDLLRKMISSLSHQYKDIEIIEEGGMGVIASAFDKERGRKVAIKTILPQLKDDTSIVNLFLQECQVIQAMNHPNVVRLFEVGKSDFLYYYVMDFLEGETLQELIDKEEKLSLDLAMNFGAQIARALQHIHSNGLVHRDIKPSNVFITPKNVAKVIDFGIARLLNAEQDYTYGSVGSPIYASPEQIRGEDVTGKSDIYSLAVCLFYMFTGEYPFNSTDLLEKMFEPPKDVRTLNPEVPENLAHSINLCLNQDPKKRLPAHELWARLRSKQV